MLHIRKQKTTLKTQENSEFFTLIIRNVQLDKAITRGFDKYINLNKLKTKK